jgi:hypothetical protein
MEIDILMKIATKTIISADRKSLASVAIFIAVGATFTLMSGCGSKPTQPSSPSLPPPRPVTVAPSQPAPPPITQTPTQVMAPAAPTQGIPTSTANTAPAPIMSVDTGLYRCELGVRVTIKKIAPDKNSLVLSWKNKDYTMTSVGSQSGALRFEEKASGLVWMAIVGKSQLLNSKIGQRLANDCNL